MKTPTRRQARFFLILVLCLAVIASVAGLALFRQGGGQAQAAVPGSTQAKADLATMQSALDSGSVAAQAALLVPGYKFAPGSKPIFPAGTKVTIQPATFRPADHFGTVRASVSGSSPVTLGLYAAGGHWRLYAVRPAPAQTRAAVTRPAAAVLTASMASSSTFKACPGKQDILKRVPVVFIHGFQGHASNWGPDSPGSMFYAVDQIPGTWTSAFDYSQHNSEWVDNPAVGGAFVKYLDCVAAASRAAGGPGKVIVIAHSMGGLITRWAASNGAQDDIAEVVTLGTPNTGATGAGFGDASRQLLCDTQSMVASPDTASFCTEFTALSGMDAYSSQIAALPELPASIPLYAIAGDVKVKDPLGGAWIDADWGSDGLVPVDSALHAPPGSSHFTTSTVTCDWHLACWHAVMPENATIQADVHNYVQTYVRAHYGAQQPLSGHPAGPSDLYPLGVVYRYYDDLNVHNYSDAWNNLGGNNIAAQNGQTYDSWVAGYSSVVGLYITGQDLGAYAGDHLVQVSITVTQKDGTVQHYAGTYTLRAVDVMDYVLIGANIHATPGPEPAPAPAQPLGGDAYWLAGGGQWHVHGAMLQISRGPSGLTGEETWNAGAQVVTGHAQLTFTSQPDGSLAGTYTRDAWYTEAQPPAPSVCSTCNFHPPSTPEMLKGQTITLVPIAPGLAKTTYDSSSVPPWPATWADGNPYWCGADLAVANPSQYCGA